MQKPTTLFFCVDSSIFGGINFKEPFPPAALAFAETLSKEVEALVFKPVKFEALNLGYDDVSFETEFSNLDQKEIKAVAFLIASKVVLETSDAWLQECDGSYVTVEVHDEEGQPIDVVLKV